MIGTKEKWNTRRKNCPSATISTTNPTRTGLGSNPGLCSDRTATNRLNHSTALQIVANSWRIDFLQHVTRQSSCKCLTCIWVEPDSYLGLGNTYCHCGFRTFRQSSNFRYHITEYHYSISFLVSGAPVRVQVNLFPQYIMQFRGTP